MNKLTLISVFASFFVSSTCFFLLTQHVTSVALGLVGALNLAMAVWNVAQFLEATGTA